MGATAATIAYSNHPQSSLFLTVPFLSPAELLPTIVGKSVRRLLPLFFDPSQHSTLSTSKVAQIASWTAQLPFYGWAFYGRTLGKLLTTMAFPTGVKSDAVPDFVTNGMDNEARLRDIARAETHTGPVLVLQGQNDHLMGQEYGYKLGTAINANSAHPINFTLHTIPGGDHRSEARPEGDASNSEPLWFNQRQKELRKIYEANAWGVVEAWFGELKTKFP